MGPEYRHAERVIPRGLTIWEHGEAARRRDHLEFATSGAIAKPVPE
jgi:hypothetical protein